MGYGTDYRQITDKVLVANTWFEVDVGLGGGTAEIEAIRILGASRDQSFGQEFDTDTAVRLQLADAGGKLMSLYDHLLSAVCPRVSA